MTDSGEIVAGINKTILDWKVHFSETLNLDIQAPGEMSFFDILSQAGDIL